MLPPSSPGPQASISRFRVTAVSPSSLEANGSAYQLQIIGTGFRPDSTVSISGIGLTVQAVQYSSASLLIATVLAEVGATAGLRNVTVGRTGSLVSNTLADCLTVTTPVPPAISIFSITPSFVQQGTTVRATILGNNIRSGVAVSVNLSGVTTNVISSTSTSIVVDITASGAAGTGPRVVTITNATLDSDSLNGAFEVTAAAPPPENADFVIDAAYIAAFGPAPYYLDQANKRYRLDTDISVPGSAFGVIASGITLDMNGHTISFDQATPITVPNGSFETGNLDGWNTSGAPNASKYAGSYINNTVYDGSYSLKFAVPCSDQYIESITAVTLEGNTTYDITFMAWKRNVTCTLYVSLVDTNGNVVHTKSYSGANNRGIQLVTDGNAAPVLFTTGSSGGSYKVRVGISGASGSASGAAYIDDVKIQRTRVYGIAVGIGGTGLVEYPGFTRTGTATDFTVIDGFISQGSDGATFAKGIGTKNSNNMTVDNVDITVNGANSNCINTTSGTVHDVQNCLLTSNVRTISDRDNAYGSVVKFFTGLFAYNTIIGGPCQGLELNTGSGTHVIHHNLIKTRGTYSNCFALFLRGICDVYENDIECFESNFAGRGIMIRNPNGTHLHNNRVTVRLFADNQEYQGAPLGGCYGIQMEAASDNANIHDNTVTVYGDAVEAYCFRTTWSDTQVLTAGVIFENNTLIAISQGAGAHAACLKLGGPLSGANLLESCTFKFNDLIIGGSQKVPGVTLLNCTFEQLASPTGRVYHESTGSTTNVHITNTNPTYTNAGASTYIAAATWKKDTGVSDPASSWTNN